MLPLNGTKSHPLSEHARAELRDIVSGPVPRSTVNPGVADEDLTPDTEPNGNAIFPGEAFDVSPT